MAANVIRQEVLLEALQIAKKSSTPVGRVLMSINELSEGDLLTAIEVQSLIRDGVISAEFGIKAINLAVKGRMSLEEAFNRLGWTPPVREEVTSGELGELLTAAGIVDKTVLEQAMRQSMENNLPLGRCLVLARALSSSMLTSALTAQVLLRDGKITQEQAIMGLKGAFRKQQTIEQSLTESGAFRAIKETIKVGDLLTQAGIVTEGDKISAIEMGLVHEQPVGQVLVHTGMISPTQLDESLRLQEMVANGELSGAQAADVLRQANSRGVTIETILTERVAKQGEVEKINAVLGLLQKSQILNADLMSRVTALTRQFNLSAGEVLLTKNLLDARILQAALQAQDLVNDDIMSEDQVARVLYFSHKSGIEFHQALKEVSWETAIPIQQEEEQPEEKPKGGWLGNLWSKVTKKDDS